MTKIAIIGYSGHSYVVIESAKSTGIEIECYTDLQIAETNPYNLEYAGNESDENFNFQDIKLKYALGIGNNDIRRKVAQNILEQGQELQTIIDASAEVSHTAMIGQGVYVGKNSSINAQARVGNFVIINTGAIVEHECVVGEGAHIAPGAVMLGNTRVGEKSFLGAGAVIKQGMRVGSNSIIGAGSVVLQDIGDNEIWAGNPAQLIKTNK